MWSQKQLNVFKIILSYYKYDRDLLGHNLLDQCTFFSFTALLFIYLFTFSYIASSVSEQDESNPALWLATRTSKMELSCPLGTTCCIPQQKLPWKPYNKSSVNQACLLKMAWYLSHPFLEFIDLDSLSVHKHTKKELGQYPAILTSHFVNNPYMLSISRPILLSNYICSSRKYVYHPLQHRRDWNFLSGGFRKTNKCKEVCKC